MKKLLIIAAAAILLALGIAGTASALHGGWSLTDTGNMCASCHRTHTAVGPQLLKEETSFLLCYSCHGPGGSQQNSRNPFTGVTNTGLRLNGGVMSPLFGATSQHTVAGLPMGGGAIADGAGTAWGGTQSGQGITVDGLTAALECVSCHNPHGSTNYRYLRDSHNGSAVSDVYQWSSPYASFSNGTDSSLPFADHQVEVTAYDATGGTSPSTRTAGDVANYTAGMRDFCASCHKSYLTKEGSASHLSTDGDYYYYPGTQELVTTASEQTIITIDPVTGVPTKAPYDGAVYRHPTSINFGDNVTTLFPVRLAASTTQSVTRTEFVCTTCHFAHGTTVTTGTGGQAGDSALLYKSGRVICLACHQQDKLGGH